MHDARTDEHAKIHRQHVSYSTLYLIMQIRKIKSIRCYMNKQSTKTLVNATVLSRLDYCNGVYTLVCYYINFQP